MLKKANKYFQSDAKRAKNAATGSPTLPRGLRPKILPDPDSFFPARRGKISACVQNFPFQPLECMFQPLERMFLPLERMFLPLERKTAPGPEKI